MNGRARRRTVAVAVAVMLVAAACKPWAGVSVEQHRAQVSNLSLEVTQTSFMQIRAAVLGGEAQWQGHRYLNWSTDGCSFDQPDTTPVYDFSASCRQHDFCYRNWPEWRWHSGTWGAGYTELRVKGLCDDKFRNNMHARCGGSGVFYLYCLAIAEGWYNAVVLYGHMGSSR